MALTKCKECGEQVSTKAEACPKCGAKKPKKTSLFTWLVLILGLYGAYIVNTMPSLPKSNALSAVANSGASVQPELKTPEIVWDTTNSVDEMTKKPSYYATSPTVLSKNPMSFPYQGVGAWLGIGCEKGKEWAYIGFTEAPNLNDTETEDGYNVINTRFKWDDSVETTIFTQDWGASFLHFENDRSSIQKLMKASTAVIELNWHGQRAVHFEFSMKGANSAIEKMRSECTSSSTK